jgi:hypothetical protein
MVRRKASPVLIGVCLGAVIAAGLTGGVSFYFWANHLAYFRGSPFFGQDFGEAEMSAWLSGFCFDTAVVAGLAALWLALRKRSRWRSVQVPFLVGGSLILAAVVYIPGGLLSLEDDPLGFDHMVLFGCILLAATGAIVVTVAVVLALMGDGASRR